MTYGDQDVVAGGTLYINPGPSPGQRWPRVTLAPEADVVHATVQRVRGWRTLVALGPRSVMLLTAEDVAGTRWSARWLASLPPGRSQGWVADEVEADGRQQLCFTRGERLLRLSIPPGFKLGLIWGMVLAASATVCFLIGNEAYRRGVRPWTRRSP